jgi:hypothetical protein
MKQLKQSCIASCEAMMQPWPRSVAPCTPAATAVQTQVNAAQKVAAEEGQKRIVAERSRFESCKEKR